MQENYPLKPGIISQRCFFSLPLLQDLCSRGSKRELFLYTTPLLPLSVALLVLKNFQSEEACKAEVRTLFSWQNRHQDYKAASSHPDFSDPTKK